MTSVYCDSCGAAENYCNCATRLGGTLYAVRPAAAATLAAPPGQRPAPCPPPPQTCGLSTTGGHSPPALAVIALSLEERAREIQDKLPPLLKWSQRNAMILSALEVTRREALEEAARRVLEQADYDHSGYTDYLPYDLAVNHCSRAIRALIDAPRKEGTMP